MNELVVGLIYMLRMIGASVLISFGIFGGGFMVLWVVGAIRDTKHEERVRKDGGDDD